MSGGGITGTMGGACNSPRWLHGHAKKALKREGRDVTSSLERTDLFSKSSLFISSKRDRFAI